MSDFNKRVKTPNGVGHAFAKLPDGKILVSHAWNKLSKEYQKGFQKSRGYKARVVIEEYEESEID